MTQRLPKWQSLLYTFVQSRMYERFCWGRHDCVLFGMDSVMTVTGVDPVPDVRGTYSTALSAYHLLESLGGMEKAVGERLGESVPPMLAQVADVAMMLLNSKPTLGVCMGGHILAPGPEGLVSLPMEEARVVWRCTRND